MKFENYIKPFILWRIKHIQDRPYILFLSALVGFASGMGAVLIKNSVHFIQHLLTQGIIHEYHTYLYFAFPTIGLLLAVLLVKYIVKQRVGHGIPSVLYSISKQNALLKPHNMFSSILTSALTVGFGGSVGLEGPTVATGASIGSNIGRLLRLTYRQRTLLLGCAAAGAMSSIFKAPIAAIVFAIEVIMLDLTMASLVPLLIASSTAALTSYFFFSPEILFHFVLKDTFTINEILYYILLGTIAGLVSVHFTRTYLGVHKIFEKVNSPWKKLVFGGLSLGILIFLFPPLYGEGYSTINALLDGNYQTVLEGTLVESFADNLWIVFGFLGLLVILKVVATSITFGAGGVGGIFAPTLFMGATMGFTFAKINNFLASHVSWVKDISLSNFTLVGMAGTIAGVLHAPLTAIFLIAEITGGYQLFIPLMVTAAISYSTIKIFEPHSVYTFQLAKRGELLTHHKDKTVLALLKVDQLIEKNFIVMKSDDTLSDLVKAIKESIRNIFPVVDAKGHFIGLIPMDNVRNIMFDQEMYDKVYVNELMIQPDEIVNSEDTMDTVMTKFRKSGNWNLPVVEKGVYLGFVSRANIFNAYRKKLVEFSED